MPRRHHTPLALLLLHGDQGHAQGHLEHGRLKLEWRRTTQPRCRLRVQRLPREEAEARAREREHGGGAQSLVHAARLLSSGVAHRAARRSADGHAGRAARAHQTSGQSARDRATQGQSGRVHASKLVARHWRPPVAVQAQRGRLHLAAAWRTAFVSAAKVGLWSHQSHQSSRSSASH